MQRVRPWLSCRRYNTTAQSNSNFLVQHYKLVLQQVLDSVPSTNPVSLEHPVPQYYKNYHEIIIPNIMQIVSPKSEDKKRFMLPEDWAQASSTPSKKKEEYFNFRNEMAKLDSTELNELMIQILKKVMLSTGDETIETYWKQQKHVADMFQTICLSYKTRSSTVNSILQQHVKECCTLDEPFDTKTQEFYIHSTIGAIQLLLIKELFPQHSSLHWVLFRIYLDIYSHTLPFKQDSTLQQYNQQFHDFIYQQWLQAMEWEEKQRETAEQMTQKEVDEKVAKATLQYRLFLTAMSLILSAVCYYYYF